MNTNIRFVRFTAASFGLALLAPAAHAQLYGTSSFQNQLWKLDMATGASLLANAMDVPSRTITGANSLTLDPTTGIAYAVVKASGVTGRLLITVDLDTGVGTEIGNLGDNFSSLAFRADGQLFGVTGDGATVPETLYLIDKANASATIATALGNGADGEVIAFNPRDGMLYHWSGNATLVFEKLVTEPPYTVTDIPVIGTTSGETFGAVWDECTGVFITSNIGSAFNTFAPDGTVTPQFGTTPDDIRGMALIGPNSCDVDLSVSLSLTPPEPTPAGAVSITALVANAGPARALAPVVTITLPPSISAATTTGCAEDPTGLPTCTLATQFLGDSASIVIDGTYDGTPISLVTVAAATTSTDTVPENDSATLGINDTIFADSFECSICVVH
jgi:hypothetical protein